MEELRRLVISLAGDESSFSTGSEFPADGGESAGSAVSVGLRPWPTARRLFWLGDIGAGGSPFLFSTSWCPVRGGMVTETNAALVGWPARADLVPTPESAW